MRAIALLSAWKVRNSLRTTFSDPRKFGPLLFFLLCMIGSIALFSFGINQPPPSTTPHTAIDTEVLRAATTLCMILLGLSVIDGGLGDSLLAFPLPDVDYLFPSPISRRLVLAFRLPGLTFGSIFFSVVVLFVFGTITHTTHPTTPVGHYVTPDWVDPASLFCSVGTFFNLAMFFSVCILDRRPFHRILVGGFLAIGAGLALIWWLFGSSTVVSVLNSDWIKWAFIPSRLASDVLVAGFAHQTAVGAVRWLCLGYVISLVPMFLANSNWYEQSIVSSERISAIRQAAKGGIGAVMAVKSAEFKHKGVKPYTITPFGLGPGALFWAHLCAAAKRPYANFLAPTLGGIALGVFGAALNLKNKGTEVLGIGVLVGISAYATMAFMQIARTASEGALRRRELLSPLPIKGWQAVAANLGVPMMAFTLFCFGSGLSYAVSGAPFALLVLCGFCILMPLRMAARMTLQYLIVIGYPDLADKIQQVLSMGVYMVLSTPFLILEILLCIPALVIQSMWVGLVTVSLFQIPLLALLLFLAGKASDKSVASGEPVNVFHLFTRRS